MKPQLIIVMDGGLVQGVCSDRPDLFQGFEVVIVDYDTDGADENEVTLVEQDDGRMVDAIVRFETVETMAIPRIPQ